jgi:biopolymer transport protein ExbD
MYCGRPDLTPLIDVLFLSLIFFIVSSSFVKLYGVKVELPKTEQSSSASLEKFISSISSNESGNKIYFNDEELLMDDLKSKLGDLKNEVQTGMVIICADKNTTVDILANVMVVVENAGLASFIVVSDDSGDSEEILFKNN